MKRICTICARGGSQGVKNKNILSLCGKPLIAHSILQAKKSGLFDFIVVSSDSKKIRDVAMKWGAHYVIDRPAALATSVAAKLPAIQHAALASEKKFATQFDIVVDLDATAPLRIVADIQNACILFEKNAIASNLITGCSARKSPYFNLVEKNNLGFVCLAKKNDKTIVRRQDAPICYDMNASIYIWKRNALFESQTVITNGTILYEMPEERSIDIDTYLDLQMVRFLTKNRTDLRE